MFRAWTQPELVETCWGPVGFKTVISELDQREGGRFRFEMTSPTGSRGATEGFYREIVRARRLVFEITAHCNCDLPAGERAQLEHAELSVQVLEEAGATTLTVIYWGPEAEAVGARIDWGWSRTSTVSRAA